MSSQLKAQLLERKKKLQKQLEPLRKLEAELHEVNRLLATYEEPERGGWEKPGHKNGCRCGECDPSW